MKRKQPASGRTRQGVLPPNQNRCDGQCLFPSSPPLQRNRSQEESSSNNDNSASGRNLARKSLPEGERLLIEDMNNLTLAEREQVYEEVHGVSTGDEIEETPAMVETALEEIKMCLAKSDKQFSEYDRAAFLVPQRVQERSFLLKFLRGDRFQAEAAALRIRRFCKFCYRWFGINGLLRDITFKDHVQDDLDVLRTAFMHLPPPNRRDRAGRPILVFFPAHNKYKDPLSVVRILFHMYWRLLREETVQKKGVVAVTWAYGDHSPALPPSVFVPAASVFSSLPLRISALHICYDRLAMMPFLEMARITAGKNLRIRMRTHYGSPMECRYWLLTFGIDANTFPLTMDGEMDPTTFWERLKEEGLVDEEQTQQTNPAMPTSTDILLGRGQPFRVFPGNQELARMVQENHNEYESADKLSRRRIVEGILRRLLDDQGRRVLKRDSPKSHWYVASRTEAFRKVDMSFRNKKQVDLYHQEKASDGRQGRMTQQ